MSEVWSKVSFQELLYNVTDARQQIIKPMEPYGFGIATFPLASWTKFG